eukprot:RCo023730
MVRLIVLVSIILLHFLALAIPAPEFEMQTCTFAGRSYPCPNIFDWIFYNQTYPDVRASSQQQAWHHWMTHGVRAGRRCHPGPPVVKIVLMTKNERMLLESWTAYHSYVFGPEALYIIDGSPRRGWVRPKGPPWIFYSKSSLHDLGLMGAINKLARSIAHSCDFLLKLDTDELVTVLRNRSNGSYYFDPGSVRRHFELLNVTGGLYGIPLWLYSVPDAGLCGRDPVSVTRFDLRKHPVDKPQKVFYLGWSFEFVDLG